MSNKKIKKIIGFSLIIFLFCFLLLNSSSVVAQTSGSTNPQLENPIGSSNFNEIIGKVIKGVLGFTGAIALIMVIYGGFTWMTSAGNEQAVKKGKDTLMWALLGLAVIFLSYTILKMVFTVLEGGDI